MKPNNPFYHLWDMGYTRLVPIVPPDAKISPKSTLFSRPGARGKAVGVRGTGGYWRGYDWVNYNCVEEDFVHWHEMGAGVGIKTGLQDNGRYLIGIDVDTHDPDQAVKIEKMIRRRFGDLPTRIGQTPKALYALWLSQPLPYSRVEFKERNGTTARIEILSDGRQFVAFGIHPVTKRPYLWSVPLYSVGATTPTERRLRSLQQ